jgi:hypothetical protein
MVDQEIPDDVPEADALEQRQDVADQPDGDTGDVLGDDSMEVPEADALEQSRIVPTDDEPDPET